MTRTGWADQAACKGADLAIFFSDVSDRAAKEYCARCPVTAECLEEVLRAEVGSRYGTYGGMTWRERAKLMAARRAAAREAARAAS